MGHNIHTRSAIQWYRRKLMKNKRPMSHISHLSEQFKSIYTYDYIITLIKRRKNLLSTLSELNGSSFKQTSIPLHPRMHCAKFSWNLASGSQEEGFKISSMYFCYIVIISPWKRQGPLFEQTSIPFTQGCIVPSLVKIGSVVLEKEVIKFRQCIFAIW